MQAEIVTIEQFMECWFNEKYENLSKENFDICYSEYIDISGLYNIKEFGLISQIHYLTNRITSVKLSLRIHREFIDFFGVPCVNEFSFLKKFSHTLYWNGNKEEFIKTLNRIESKESKYVIELERIQDELHNLRSKTNSKQPTVVQTRHQFIRLLNDLSKIGYRLERQTTTIEELALMIKQQSEEAHKK